MQGSLRQLATLLRAGRLISTQNSSKAAGQLDQMLGSCLLERLPVVVPKDEDWELEYYRHQASLLGKYNTEMPAEFQESEASKAEATAEAWEPAPFVTKADRSNDQKSVQRKLDRRLIFMVKSKGPDGERWGLPATSNLADESMRQTAERALGDAVGSYTTSNVYFVGHAPCAHHLLSGSTCFVNKAQLVDGSIDLKKGSDYIDYAWLCREEVLDRITDQETKQVFTSLLPTSL